MAIELNTIKKKKNNKSNVGKAVSNGSSLMSNPIRKSDGTALNGGVKNKSTLPKVETRKSAAKPLSDMIAMQFSGNAVARNNAIAGAKVYDAAKSYSNRSKETAARYKRIAATKEIQDKAKGQSYLKKELPKSGLMLGGDPVARNRAIQTGIKANATEEEREAQAAKDLIAAANSPVERFMQGLGRGLALGPTTRFSWQEETPTEKMVSDLTNNTVSGAAGNMVGEALPYLMAYGKLGGAVGDAAMKLPGAAKLGGLGQGVVKSLAADTVLGAPLNANYVVNKQGLRGKEAVKEFAKQEALDLGLGVGMEGLSHFIRNRAKAVTHYDYDKINEQIGKMFKNELPVQEVFNFGKTPKAIQKYGAENLDMTMSQATLRKIVYPKGYFGGEHNLGFNAIEFLRGQIENPVAVLKSNTQKDSLVIVTELLDAENNLVIVPLHLSKQGQLGISNTIPSMYGKKEFDKFINTQRDMGNILFEDKKRIITAPLSGLQLPGLVANNDPMIRISRSGKKVKENVLFEDKKIGLEQAPSVGLQLPKLVANSDPMNEAIVASNNSILPLAQKNVKKDLGADANSYLTKSQVSKLKSNTFDSTRANRELPRTVTPGELMQDMTSYINADTVTPQSRKVYNEYLSSAKRLQEIANDATVEIKEQSISRFTSSENQRLTNNDLKEYLRTGKEEKVHQKRKLSDNGEKLILSNNEEIKDFVNGAIDGKIRNIEKAYGKTGNRFVEEIKEITNNEVDLSGHYLELSANDLKHSYNQHEKPKEPGDISLSRDDYIKTADYIDDYDDILEVVPTKNGIRIKLGKKINGYSVITEMVSDSKKAVKFKNMWGVSTVKYNERYKKSNPRTLRASLQQKLPESYSPANVGDTSDIRLSEKMESVNVKNMETNLSPQAKPISNIISDQMRRSSKSAAESARERFFDFSRKLYTETVDNLHPLARLDEKIKILSSNMRKSKGTADSILHNGMVDMAGKNIAPSIDGVTRTLDDVFASAATADKKAFNEYLLHKVNAERAPRGKGILENVSAADSRNAIKELEKSYPQFKTYGDFIYANNDILIDEWYVKSGLISKELGEKLKKMYRNYVPVMRDGITNTEGFNKKVISAAQMVKTAKGGNNPIIAPDVALAIHMEKAVRAARTNELNLELLNIVRKNPEKFDGAIKLADGNITKYDNTILKGGTELLNEEGLDAMDNVLDNLMGKDIKGNYYVVAMENGKPVRMNVNEEIYNALKTLQRNPSDETATKMLNIVNRYWSGPFKALITGLNPFFAVRNAIRDIPTAYIQGTENNVFRFVRNLIDATRGIVKNDPMFQEYVALGGKQGGYFNVEGGLGAPTGIKKKLSKPVELITAINELTEAAPRYAEYLGTLKRSEGGLKNASYDDIQRALYNSGEVTVNFGRYGDVTKTVDKFVPYLNPAVQGIDKFFRSMGSSPATAAKAAMVLSIPTVALHLYNEAYHKEDYERLDDRTKDTYYCFYIPNSDGKFVRIPKSREAGVLFSVLPERMIRYIGGDDEAFRGFGNTVATNFAPQSPVENNILAPAVYYLPQNKDFAGRTIVPDRLKDLYAYEQYDEKTSEVAKWLGSAAAELGINNGEGLSPKQIDYIIDSYTGIIGDVLIPATTEGGNVFERVVTGPFVVDNVYSNNIQNDFYSAMDSMNKERNHIDMTGGAEAQWRTPEDRMYSYYLAASKEMSDLRKKERELAVLPNSKEKSEAQRELRKQINAIAEEALAGADAAYAGYRAEYVPEISDMSESRQEFYRKKLKPLGMEASEYRRLFNSFDLDGNKSISQKEVKEVLDASGLSETKKALMFEAACPNAKKNPYR